jgi:hypothetical protein
MEAMDELTKTYLNDVFSILFVDKPGMPYYLG